MFSLPLLSHPPRFSTGHGVSPATCSAPRALSSSCLAPCRAPCSGVYARTCMAGAAALSRAFATADSACVSSGLAHRRLGGSRTACRTHSLCSARCSPLHYLWSRIQGRETNTFQRQRTTGERELEKSCRRRIDMGQCSHEGRRQGGAVMGSDCRCTCIRSFFSILGEYCRRARMKSVERGEP